MPAERIAIVGGGPAGLATARSYREHGGAGELTLVAEEPRPPYERPPLTKGLLRGEVDVGELAIEQPEWFESHDVGLRLGTAASAIDPSLGSVTLSDGDQLEVDVIVLATGSEPVRPPIAGAQHRDIVTVRRLPDSLALAERMRAPGAVAVVVGTGFIGCEIAGSLALDGAPVVLLGEDRLPQINRLGEAAAERIAGWLEELGVRHIGEIKLREIHDGKTVILEDGRRLPADCVVLATGVRPRGELAAAAGVTMSDGAVLVDDAMRSLSHPHRLLAVGDVATAFNATAQRRLRVEHWGDALGHGDVAGRTLANGSGRWGDVPGFWSTIGDRTMKHAAWGDGYDEARLVAHDGGAFTVWYSRDGLAVGVLTHERDEDYEHGRELIAAGDAPP